MWITLDKEKLAKVKLSFEVRVLFWKNKEGKSCFLEYFCGSSFFFFFDNLVKVIIHTGLKDEQTQYKIIQKKTMDNYMIFGVLLHLQQASSLGAALEFGCLSFVHLIFIPPSLMILIYNIHHAWCISGICFTWTLQPVDNRNLHFLIVATIFISETTVIQEPSPIFAIAVVPNSPVTLDFFSMDANCCVWCSGILFNGV